MIELATCSWRMFHPEMGVAVRITVGNAPRWFAHPHEHVPQLAPPRKLLRIADSDWEGFRKAYRHKLHRQTPQRLQRVFDDLSRKHDGRRLVLLCFESDPADCHRGLFSYWWFEQTGQEVPELGDDGKPVAAQPALFGEEDA